MLVQILVILGIAALIWLLYRGIKSNPQAFSRENLSKSFTTLGVLGLALIAVIAFAVMMLRH